jgi:hypothetical protein
VEEERERLIEQLRHALAEVKTLSGLLPICANCKKIRDDKGYWSVTVRRRRMGWQPRREVDLVERTC